MCKYVGKCNHFKALENQRLSLLFAKMKSTRPSVHQFDCTACSIHIGNNIFDVSPLDVACGTHNTTQQTNDVSQIRVLSCTQTRAARLSARSNNSRFNYSLLY